MSDTAMDNTAMNDLAKIVVFALLFALAFVTGCDGFETTDVNWSADASPHALDVAANGIAMAMGSAVITIASEDSDYRIRAQAMNGEAFSLDLNNVDGSGTYYVAPIDGRTAHGYYIDADGLRYTIREASSQTVQVTEFTSSRLAGTMSATAATPRGANARYLVVAFDFEL